MENDGQRGNVSSSSFEILENEDSSSVSEFSFNQESRIGLVRNVSPILSTEDETGVSNSGNHQSSAKILERRSSDKKSNLFRRFYDLFRRQLSTGYVGRRLLHDVAECRTIQQRDEILSRIYEGMRFANILIVADHRQENEDEWGHLHIVHDCTWSHSTCRCKFLTGVTVKKRLSKFGEWSSSLNCQRWLNCAVYLHTLPRQPFIFKVAHKCWQRNNKDGNISLQESSLEAGERMVDECNETNPIPCQHLRRTITNSSSELSGHSSGNRRKRLRKEGGTEAEIVYEFLQKFIPTPLENASQTVEWLRDRKLKFITKQRQSYKDAIEIFEKEWMILSISEMYSKLKNSTPVFDCVSGDLYATYYTLAESIELLEKFLSYHFNHDGELITEFINILYNVLNKTSGNFKIYIQLI